MTARNRSNEPAFPRTYTKAGAASLGGRTSIRPADGTSGITIREYYADQALTGLVSGQTAIPASEMKNIAQIAWGLADAMLEEQ